MNVCPTLVFIEESALTLSMTTRADVSQDGLARDARLMWMSVETTHVIEASVKMTCHDTYVTVHLDGVE